MKKFLLIIPVILALTYFVYSEAKPNPPVTSNATKQTKPVLVDSPNVKKVEKEKPAKKRAVSSPTKQPKVVTPTITSSNILNLINGLRRIKGLNQLQQSSNLNATAARSVQSMIQRQACSRGEWCDHGNWQQWYAQSGFTYFGEIIAACQTSDRQLVYDSWLNSPTHYARMVSTEYSYFGVAVASGPFTGDYSGGKTITCKYYVVHFGG